jgi:prepilin-type N-terminal cleavage/methylation domain-containing protein/prepilin-type processing-associated H-X9-DG protein
MSRPTRPSSSGFTMIEMLVVTGIIGVLIALLLPAVQKVRDASNRTTCANNLKQIGMGLHGFHNQYGYLPESNSTEPFHHSWVYFVLPFMERKDVYDLYHPDHNWFNDSNQQAVSTQLKGFTCPAAPLLDRVDTTFPSLPACIDYNVTRFVDENLPLIGLIPPTQDLRGAMMEDERTRFAQISDGLSNTTLLAEDAGRPQLWLSGAVIGSGGPDGGFATGGAWADDKGPLNLNGATADGNTDFNGPCAVNCTNSNEIYSFHTGGANLLFVDCSVHFVRTSIPISVMAALWTRAGGENVSGTDY